MQWCVAGNSRVMLLRDLMMQTRHFACCSLRNHGRCGGDESGGGKYDDRCLHFSILPPRNKKAPRSGLKLDPFGQRATSRYGEGVAKRPPARSPKCCQERACSPARGRHCGPANTASGRSSPRTSHPNLPAVTILARALASACALVLNARRHLRPRRSPTAFGRGHRLQMPCRGLHWNQSDQKSGASVLW